MRLLVLLTLLGAACGYHVLVLFPVPSRSHNNLGKGFVNALLKAGHQVTWATPYPPKKAEKGLTIIDVSVTRPIIEAVDMTNMYYQNMGIALVKEYSRNISRAALTPELKQAIVSNQYDAVVTEMFFTEVDSGYAAIQQVPWILFMGSTIQPPLQALVDEARSIPLLPILFTNFQLPLNFWQRMVVTGIYIGMRIVGWLEVPVVTALYQDMFGPLAAARGVPLPDFSEAYSNVSILFVNSHPSMSHANSLPPNVVEIAGYHIDEDTPPLPKDLQDLLDSSPQGVVYFSMGSVIKSTAIPQHTRKELLKLFGSLPYTVLWKFEEQLEGLPKNVHIKSWMPQASILAHPNVRLFITHGGMLSSLEALQYGVPLLALPVFGDQESNANRAVSAGYALKVKFSPDMTPELEETLKKMMNDDQYLKKVKSISTLFRNRPVSPSKLISHYIEVAIESKGAYHLRSKTHLYAWYQRFMLDQAAALIAFCVLIYIIIKKTIQFVINKVKGSPKPVNNKNNKKQKKN